MTLTDLRPLPMLRWTVEHRLPNFDDEPQPLLPNRPPQLPPSTPASPEIRLQNPRFETGVTTVRIMGAKATSRSAHYLDRCIRALANYTPRRQHVKYPREKSAAVLVALFVGRKGDLYVLLSRCASQDQTLSPGNNPSGVHPPCVHMPVILPYQVERWTRTTGTRKKQP